MLVLLSAGIAPGFALLCYFYLRDQFEPEPILAVAKAFLYGALVTLPVMFVQFVITHENWLSGSLRYAFFHSSLPEEFCKWLILAIIVFYNREFTEPFDGIVYGVSVSLGFATIENILSLFSGGVYLAFGRALLPVSSHALFGVIMGYYLGKARFSPHKKGWLFLSFALPFTLHGFYDLIMLTQQKWLYYMIPFMFGLWWLSLKKAKQAHSLSAQHFAQEAAGTQQTL
ncbi:protease PrsW [Weizmannia acidilactici]|uniref:Protease PrsW n=1 Tax=Weizmannia acidilactici TaxID=2607726 RepID=A0A5J4JBN6_9BACI|nr:glutamic-type intramembrane protease PrsW [Weizmannia acidilactici]GER66042.1 protease PrsW [Weizmannia acidilactici]GER69323.1 protease PrsW [Weizmannia acidilactici]GER72351.1 protease PrsW [Weizmannia acidilactici]